MQKARVYIFIQLSALAVIAFVVMCLYPLNSSAKDGPWKRLSRPEKIWSGFHPMKARKVLTCARRSQFVTDSLEKADVMNDKNGGQLDAFRHAYWNALMIVAGLPERVVTQVGNNHERGNYLDYKRGKLEDSLRADSMACEMDLRNNASGISIGKKFLSSDRKTALIELVIAQIWNGKLVVLNKDADGHYIDCNDHTIDLSRYKGQWYIPKCIVSSDHVPVTH